jgi:hypothetical protein
LVRLCMGPELSRCVHTSKLRAPHGDTFLSSCDCGANHAGIPLKTYRPSLN